MKKLVILLFLFLGGVCLEGGIKDVYATNVESKSSIYFTETYVYTPTPEGVYGVTPTGNPPRNWNEKLPQTSESTSSIFIRIGGILLLGASTSMMIKNYWKWELKNEKN